MAIGSTRLQIATTQRFASGFVVRAALDVDLRAGSILVVFGPSGAGKTTILRQVAGLERPDRGQIRFGDQAWCDTDARVWLPPQRRRIGLVFQQPTLFPHLTVASNVRYGVAKPNTPTPPATPPVSDTYSDALNPRPVSDTYIRTLNPPAVSDTYSTPLKVEEIEMVLGIRDLENRYPRSLSGGEAQRVALARALAPGPALLLLDEPFAALDAPTRIRLRRDLHALLARTATPAILVTHDRTEALALADQAAIVIDGAVRQVGPTADVFSHPADADVAASLGIEAVIPARIVAADAGVVTLDVGSAATLYAAERDRLPAGSNVFACIRAEDVGLELQSPAHASARNHLTARVTAITPEGPIDRVSLDCGFALDALITRRSRDELQLAPGAVVTAVIKATSIHLVTRM